MKIYHNPRCTKSRQTLALLQEHEAEPEVVEYLKTPPTANELAAIVRKLGISPLELVRRKEAKEEGIDVANMADADILQAMADHPRIIERPIVVSGKQAAIGRPPENVLDLL